MSELPDDGYKAYLESEANGRRALDKTEWVENLRRELIERRDGMEYGAYPDEKALIGSVVEDLRILSHNLAVRRGEASREFIGFADYHYENADQSSR